MAALTAKIRLTPARGYRLVQRDMIVVGENGTFGIVRAGTVLPLYDEELIIERDEPNTGESRDDSPRK